MSTELHVYTGGEDPFEAKLPGIRLIIHAGSPPSARPDPKESKAPEILVPTDLGSPYRDLWVRDLDDPEKLRKLLGDVTNGTDLRVRATSGDAHGAGLDKLLSGLKDADVTDVRVHVVPDDSDG